MRGSAGPPTKYQQNTNRILTEYHQNTIKIWTEYQERTSPVGGAPGQPGWGAADRAFRNAAAAGTLLVLCWYSLGILLIFCWYFDAFLLICWWVSSRPPLHFFIINLQKRNCHIHRISFSLFLSLSLSIYIYIPEKCATEAGNKSRNRLFSTLARSKV